jgi:hypothetical protein
MGFDDNTPDNGDESSNRQFIIVAAGLGGVFIIGLIVLVLVLVSRQGARQQIADGNGTAAALQTEQAIAQVSDTPAPTDTEAPPTNTPTPSATPALPTQTFTPELTQLIADVSVSPGASGTAGTSAAASPGTGTSVSPTGTRAAATTARPAGTTARSTATGSGSTSNSSDLPSTGIGEVAGLMFAGFLVLLIVAARRMRVSQS